MGIKSNQMFTSGVFTGYHTICKIVILSKPKAISTVVNSYSSEDSYNASGDILWQQTITIPMHSIFNGTDPIVSAEEYLVTDPNSVFVGGTLATEIPEDSLEAAKIKKIEYLNNRCSYTILQGFESVALGEPHTYPAKFVDQANLVASVLDSTLPGISEDWVTPFWSCDSTGQWAFRNHSASQIQKVGKDGKLSILANMSKNELLISSVKQSLSIEEVNQITWDELYDNTP